MRQPNLLFLFTDEQRYDTLAAYGNTLIEMPNLNRLAEQSTVFDRAYVTQPICTPSRSSLLTGLYPHTNGCVENNIPLRPDTPCLPELLQAGQYVTGYHGKWHLGDEIYAQHGFEEFKSIEDMYIGHYGEGRNRSDRSDYHHWLVARGYEADKDSLFRREAGARLPEDASKPAFLAEAAPEFMRLHKDQPWCLFVNFLEPHMPFFGPRDDQYDPKAIPLPGNYDSPPTEAQHLRPRIWHEVFGRSGHDGQDLKSEQDWRELRARYWGLCSQVDTHVGTILNALKELGLWDSTIIVFTSDHGDMMGSHQCLTKGLMYEEAIRVPLLVKLPGQRECIRVNGPVGHVDLVPTLLEAMGQAIPDELEGRSLLPLMNGSAEPLATDDVFVEWNPMIEYADPIFGRGKPREHLLSLAPYDELREAMDDTIRTVLTPDGWKLNASEIGMHELYNLIEDPQETHNLARDPRYKSTMDELLSRIRSWQERTQDTAAIEK